MNKGVKRGAGQAISIDIIDGGNGPAKDYQVRVFMVAMVDGRRRVGINRTNAPPQAFKFNLLPLSPSTRVIEWAAGEGEVRRRIETGKVAARAGHGSITALRYHQG